MSANIREHLRNDWLIDDVVLSYEQFIIDKRDLKINEVIDRRAE